MGVKHTLSARFWAHDIHVVKSTATRSHPSTPTTFEKGERLPGTWLAKYSRPCREPTEGKVPGYLVKPMYWERSDPTDAAVENDETFTVALRELSVYKMPE